MPAARPITKLVGQQHRLGRSYIPTKDGNVFQWILERAQALRDQDSKLQPEAKKWHTIR